jgi:hypothetical protein
VRIGECADYLVNEECFNEKLITSSLSSSDLGFKRGTTYKTGIKSLEFKMFRFLEC